MFGFVIGQEDVFFFIINEVNNLIRDFIDYSIFYVYFIEDWDDFKVMFNC